MRTLNSLILAALILILPFFVFAEQEPESLPKLIVFFSPSCHRCIQIKAEVMPKIERDFKGRITIEYRDISGIDNYSRMIALKEQYKSDVGLEMPVFFFEGRFLNGKADVENGLRGIIARSTSSFQGDARAPSVNLIERFKSFKPLAISVAALEDGINPCAFTVIVFFISFLALQGYRKKEIAFIGLSFISAVFLTYLLIGIGIFNFLYALKGFWAITRAFNISIGVLSIILAFLAVYDFFKFRKTGDTEGLVLQLPKSVKNRINKIIGLHYRLTSEQKSSKANIAKLTASAFITGFLVSLLEAVCTGQLYLPTIAFVFKATTLKLHALGYLLLYNLLFIMPLVVIFFLSLLGTTSEEFSKFLKSHLGAIKISMAVIFFCLGLYLLWRG